MIRSYEVLAALPAVCCAVGMSACGGDSPTATEDDAPPSLSISEPSLDGDQVFTSTVVTFSATATDEEDGDISDEIEWLSSLDGPIGSGASNALALSPGSHTITARVDDSSGQTASATRMLTSSVFTWKSVAAGGGHTCGISFENRAYCWGNNSDGQLGYGGVETSDVAVAVEPTARFEYFSAGYAHTCAVRIGGGVLCWGDTHREYGILGNGEAGGSATPTLVDGSGRFRSLTSGEDYTCALDDVGAVHCWGSNWLGTLGRGVDRSQIEYATTPGKADTSVQMERLAGRNTHAYALDAGGSAYCWGSASTGQIGDGIVADWVLSPKAVLDELHWEAIAAAPFYTLAIAEGGRLYYWGSRIVMNGHGYQDLSDLQLSPDTLPTQDLFAEVAGGSAYACARRVDGRLYCWGGAYSQIIDPRNEHPPLVPVGGSHTYAQIAAGDQHTCGLTTTGEIYCWGRGDDGALGNGLRGSTNGPVRVVDPAS